MRRLTFLFSMSLLSALALVACGSSPSGSGSSGSTTPLAEDCAPQRVSGGEGDCDMWIGYFWDGTTCSGTSGCGCIGEDCGGVFGSEDQCREAYSACPGAE